MPIFLGAVLSFFSSVFNFLVDLVGKKLAVGTAIAAAFAAIWATFAGVTYALWNGIQYTLPGTMTGVLQLISYHIPSNFLPCASVLATALIAKKMLALQTKWVELMAASR